MPRRGRLHIPGGCYHVIGRGLERRYIFREQQDKQEFLERLGRCLSVSQSQCLAWALMSNHYHLLIRVGSQPLANLMSPLLGGYGGYYNRRHDRTGYVFQNRFKSILCDEDSYLLELVRYIHLNPCRANMVSGLDALDSYPWTGHRGMVNKNQYSWHAVDEVLCRFGESRKKARNGYRDFIGRGINNPSKRYSGGGLVRSYDGWESISRLRSEHKCCIGDERILGSSQFVERALFDDELQIDARTSRKQQGWNLDLLIDTVCEDYNVERLRLTSKARGNELALVKSLVCFWGAEELGVTLVEIAMRLEISQQAVSKWVKKGRDYCRSEQLSLDDLSC